MNAPEADRNAFKAAIDACDAPLSAIELFTQRANHRYNIRYQHTHPPSEGVHKEIARYTDIADFEPYNKDFLAAHSAAIETLRIAFDSLVQAFGHLQRSDPLYSHCADLFKASYALYDFNLKAYLRAAECAGKDALEAQLRGAKETLSKIEALEANGQLTDAVALVDEAEEKEAEGKRFEQDARDAEAAATSLLGKIEAIDLAPGASRQNSITNVTPISPFNRGLRTLKMIGAFSLYLALLAGVILIGVMFLRGGVWLSERVTPWLFTVSWIALAVSVLGLLPLCVSKETRNAAGGGLLIASYIFGATLWFWSLLITYTLWGWVALITGLCIAGLGVLPIALLATAFKSEWALFGELLLLMLTTFGTRSLGFYFINRYQQDSGEPGAPVKLLVATWLLFSMSFIPRIGYLALAACLICAVALLFSKSRIARKHGKVSLAIVLALQAIFFLAGFVFYDNFPAPK